MRSRGKSTCWALLNSAVGIACPSSQRSDNSRKTAFAKKNGSGGDAARALVARSFRSRTLSGVRPSASIIARRSSSVGSGGGISQHLIQAEDKSVVGGQRSKALFPAGAAIDNGQDGDDFRAAFLHGID